MLTTVLLDLDGTLLDSNDAHAESWVETLREFGIEKTFPEVRQLIGMGSDQLLPELAGISADSSKGKSISERRGEIFRQKYLHGLKPFPGAKKLVQKMISHDLQLVVATSSSKEDLEGILKKIGIEDLIQHTTSADDVDRSKPEPDIILEALKIVQASPEESIMLGDTPYDIKAAERAGVETIAFTCGGWRKRDLKDAVAIYQDPLDLLKKFETSVLSGERNSQLVIRV